MRISFILLFLTILCCNYAYSQELSAYVDFRDRFYIFDGGESVKVEDVKPESFKVGGNSVLYRTSAGHLKMYYKGEVIELERSGATNYYATDYLAAYNIFEKLKVIHKDSIIELSTRCTAFLVLDSLVAFYDKNLESLRVFYEGEIQDVESGMVGTPLERWAGADNVFAYISSRTKDFKVWYQGEVFTIERNVEDTQYKVGRDILAFVNELDETFNVFYRGEKYVLDEFKPQSFKVGNEAVAYVTNAGEFKLFKNGDVYVLSGNSPESYLVEDNIVAFVEDGYFKTWNDKKVVEVEAYIPLQYKLDHNTIAYLDNSSRIWIYKFGEKKYLSNDFVKTFEIYRDLIQMSVKVDRNLTYYNGKFYEGVSY